MGVTLAYGRTGARYLRRVLPYLGTGFIVWFLLRHIHPRDVGRLLQTAEWGWVAVGVGWYFVTNVFRAYRFGTLLAISGWRRPLSLVPDMVLLSFLNNTLPARAGEVSFPLLLRRRHGNPLGESATLLLLVRLFDVLAVAGLYLIFASLTQGTVTSLARQLIVSVALLLLPVLLILASLPWLGRHSLRLARAGVQQLNLHHASFSQWCLAIGHDIVETTAGVHSLSVYLPALAWSLLGWLSTFAWFAAFLRAFGLPLPYPQVVVGATFATLAKALPFITIGGFGAHDAGWAFGFHLIGLPATAAITSGFAVNLLTLLTSLLFVVLLLGWGRMEDSQPGGSVADQKGEIAA